MVYRKIFLLPYLDQEKRFIAQTKANTTKSQHYQSQHIINRRFCFFHFLTDRAFLIDRLFVLARKTDFYSKVLM